MTSRVVGSWLFGTLLLAFYIGFLVFAPAVLPDFKLKMLGILSGLLTGLFVYFISGEITTKISANVSRETQLVIQATGGLALGVITVLYWAYAPTGVQPTSDALTQLSQLLQNGSGAKISTNPGDKTLVVHTSPQVRSLAKDIVQSDPQYKALESLQLEKVNVRSFTAATAALPAASSATANLSALQTRFSAGIGPYRFDMTPDQVNMLLPVPFGNVSSELQKAGEYKSADVRYLWLYLSKFPTSGADSALYDALQEFHECWSGDSYITWQFANGKLMHISVRLLPDCRNHSDLLHQMATALGIGKFDPTGPVAFQVQFNGVTAAGYNGNDLSTFDVFLSDSPSPTN